MSWNQRLVFILFIAFTLILLVELGEAHGSFGLAQECANKQPVAQAIAAYNQDPLNPNLILALETTIAQNCGHVVQSNSHLPQTLSEMGISTAEWQYFETVLRAMGFY